MGAFLKSRPQTPEKLLGACGGFFVFSPFPPTPPKKKMPKLTSLLTLVALTLLINIASAKPNILFITVDDMSCDSVGAYGCKLPDTTPNMDKLAKSGMKFMYGHVQVGHCKPSRNVMHSGLYPHTNGVEGFYSHRNSYPMLADLMKQGGYYTAIRGKITHSTPYTPYPGWDAQLDTVDGKKLHFKDAQSYYTSTKKAIAEAKKAGKPFCLLSNISDPHKPFYNPKNDPHVPSRVFKADEVPVPGFLHDSPAVRGELALYYSTVRRGDDAVGATLRALEESGEKDNTFIFFLSDHGMPLPFAKTQVYHHSTWTPWIVSWPKHVKPGSVEKDSMVSAIDILPTLLDVAGLKHPKGLQGRSFLPLLDGEKQKDRDYIVKEYNESAGRTRQPMRAIEDKQYLYIFNIWSDGKDVFRNATRGTATYREMQKLAPTNEKIAARLKLLDYRVVEELYDISKDPDALVNLIDDPEYKNVADKRRKMLEDWMVETKDHALEPFRKRDDAEFRRAYIQERVDARKKLEEAEKKAKSPKKSRKTRPEKK